MSYVLFAETEHYRIVDTGEDWEPYFVKRFHLEIKPEFAKSASATVHAGTDTGDLLIPRLRSAEEFHVRNEADVVRSRIAA